MRSRLLAIAAVCGAWWCAGTAAAVNTPSPCPPETVSVHCGRTPTTAWHKGEFWVVFVQGEHVYLTRTRDGESYSKPLAVNAAPESIDANGESRPKIALTPKAALVSWTQKTSAKYTGAVRYSRSTDGGQSFSKPRPAPAQPGSVSQRFDSLSVAPDGTVYLAWLDKTPAADEAAADVSRLLYAVSDNHGKTFSGPYDIAAPTCECCRIAARPHAGGVDFLWRHIYGDNIRDHAFARVNAQGERLAKARATVDNWHIQACPHHGPSMAAADGGAHLAWFTNGIERSGLYYGYRRETDGQLSRVKAMDERPGASHPQVLQQGHDLYYAWKYFDGEKTHILLAQSRDGGARWQQPVSLATTEGASDHPLLLAAGERAFLSWHSDNEGLRLLPLPPTSPAEGG